MYVLVLKSEQFEIVLMFSLLCGVREARSTGSADQNVPKHFTAVIISIDN